MRTLVGAAEPEPIMPWHNAVAQPMTYSTAGLNTTSTVVISYAPAEPERREPYRTTAWVERPRAIEGNPE